MLTPVNKLQCGLNDLVISPVISLDSKMSCWAHDMKALHDNLLML